MLKPNKLKSSGRNFAIKVEDVDKSFEIPEERIGSLKGYFLNPLKLFKQKNKKFEALSDINFTIKKGEFIGIIGRNGSGKSTLLKLIAGIYTPDRGRIKINGKLIPFLELGVGFNPELSAKENIFLNGAILGMSRKFLKLKMDEIIDFAEIREFIDTPIKNFSSGMVVRLAFSIAIQAKGDVYLLDEILSVGDVGFRSKSLKKMQELLRSGATVLYVSHDMATVEQLTDRAILLEKGRIVETGDPKKLVENYIASLLSGNEKLKFLKRNQKQKKGPSNDISAALTANDISYIVELSKDSGDGRAKITDVKIIDSSGEVTDDLIKGEKYKIVFEADIYDKIPNPLVHLGFRVNPSFPLLEMRTTKTGENRLPTLSDQSKIKVEFSFLNILNPGKYYIWAHIAENKPEQKGPLHAASKYEVYKIIQVDDKEKTKYPNWVGPVETNTKYNFVVTK